MPYVGWSQRTAKDTLPLPSISYGNKGANQVYDFSALSPYSYDTSEYRALTSGQQTNFPNANLAITADGINFLMTRIQSTLVTGEGVQGVLNGINTWVQFNPVSDVFHLPTVYNNTFSKAWAFDKTVNNVTVDLNGTPVTLNAVRVQFNATDYDTIDGWGKIITPVGAYKGLRGKRKEFNRTIITYKLFSFSTWTTLSDKFDTTVRYNYMTKETKGNVVNFEYDTLDNIISATYSLVPPNAPVADFSWVNPNGGLVNFTDLSDNYPTSWSWDFGDGSPASTQQNPIHTFAANGTYNVCLTATNAGGSHQVCKSVVVSGIPATVADFSWVNPNGGLVNFTDLSSNNPTSWSWDFGDGSALGTAQNPSHVYSSNNTYNVCLTATNGGGSNQVCKNVVVSNISSVNNPPVANTDIVTLTQATSIIIYHVAGNDLDPDGDNICMISVWGSPYVTEYIGGSCDMVSIVPDSTFVGTDTAWYQLCDDGTPVLCDTGMIIFTVTADPALLPVASWSADVNLFSCSSSVDAFQNYEVVSTSTNADSTYWVLRALDAPCTDSSTSFWGDTINFVLSQIAIQWACSGFGNLEVCMLVSNQFGWDAKCDTICAIVWLGISETSLSNISLYPNPSPNILTVDMHNNNDEATRNYSAIEIYNALGEKVLGATQIGTASMINISVEELADGMYIATLVDAKGMRRTLGRFSVMK